MTRKHNQALGFTLVALLSGLNAQDEEVKPSPSEVLHNSIAKMVKLGSVKFKTIETQDSASSRAMMKQIAAKMGGMGGGDDGVEIRGSSSNGIVKASLNDGEDEVMSYRGRLIARNDDVGWKLRRNRLVTGGKLPFVLDAGRFFEALTALPQSALKVRDSKESTYRDRQILIVGLTLEDENAQDFALSGALPPVAGGMGGFGGMMMLGRLGGGAAPAPRLPELTVDIALYIEPTTGYVHKIKTRSYQKSSGGMGATRIVIGGAGGGFGGDEEEDEEEEEEEEVKEKNQNGERVYKRGLAVRKLRDNLSKMNFDITLSNHAKPVVLKLDTRARRLLRYGSETVAPKK